ncbi:hypothetical protein QLX08_005375 [Tetragonisca angustula]|uniref:Uncharacterized protein n=1 Tax=Tetragonisca angustula TaxID=166442 RepID=A0AAW0ZYB5_9HYME
MSSAIKAARIVSSEGSFTTKRASPLTRSPSASGKSSIQQEARRERHSPWTMAYVNVSKMHVRAHWFVGSVGQHG